MTCCFSQVAWSVARSTSFSTRMNPITFDRVLVNVGDIWNPSTNTATIRRSGFYFLHLGSGIHRGIDSHHYVTVNNVNQFAADLHSSNHNGVITVSRSGILHLVSGAVVKTTTDTPGLYSDSGLQVMFIGFLLYF